MKRVFREPFIHQHRDGGMTRFFAFRTETKLLFCFDDEHAALALRHNLFGNRADGSHFLTGRALAPNIVKSNFCDASMMTWVGSFSDDFFFLHIRQVLQYAAHAAKSSVFFRSSVISDHMQGGDLCIAESIQR